MCQQDHRPAQNLGRSFELRLLGLRVGVYQTLALNPQPLNSPIWGLGGASEGCIPRFLGGWGELRHPPQLQTPYLHRCNHALKPYRLLNHTLYYHNLLSCLLLL